MNVIDVYGPYPDHLKSEQYAVSKSTIPCPKPESTEIRWTLKTQLDSLDNFQIIQDNPFNDKDKEWTYLKILTQLEYSPGVGFEPLEGYVRTSELSTFRTNRNHLRLNPNWSDLTWIYQKYLNVPYRWGGRSTQSTDCSGLVYQIYRDLGYILPRYAHGQYQVCQEISPRDLKRGDLIFGMYSSSGSGSGSGLELGLETELGTELETGRAVHVMIYLGEENILESCGQPSIFTTRICTFQQKWARSRRTIWSGWPIEGTEYYLRFGRPLVNSLNRSEVRF